MRLKTHLSLGRVSNLPTVWTNVLAAGALSGATLDSAGWLPLLLAMSLFYIAGMYYNDVCDSDHDAQHQSHRPIPSGLISRDRVAAFALMYVFIGFCLVYAASVSASITQGNGNIGWLIGTFGLVACIVAYDRHHKNNPLSPLLMAGCRISVLITTSYTLTATMPLIFLLAIVAMLSWLIGLTYLAKHEQSVADTSTSLKDLWPLGLLSTPIALAILLSASAPWVLIPIAILIPVVYISRSRMYLGPDNLKGGAIALMIAGICLVDGIFMAWIWGTTGAITSVLAFGLTLGLQRYVRGT